MTTDPQRGKKVLYAITKAHPWGGAGWKTSRFSHSFLRGETPVSPTPFLRRTR